MSNRTADLDLTGATEAFCARLSAEGRPRDHSRIPPGLARLPAWPGSWSRVSSAGRSRPGSSTRCSPPGRLSRVSEARSAASLHRMKAAVRAFFAWAVEAGVVDDNPARSIRMHRLPRKLPVFLTAAEKKRLLGAQGRTDFLHAARPRHDRGAAGHRSGLASWSALDMDDIDLDAKTSAGQGECAAGQVHQDRPPHIAAAVTWPSVVDMAARKWKFCSLSNRDGRLCQRQIANRLAHWLRKARIEKGTDAARAAAHLRHPPLRRDQ